MKLHNVSSSVNKWWCLWGVSGSVTWGWSLGDWMVIFTLKLKIIWKKNLNVASVIGYLSQWLCGLSSFRSPCWSGSLRARAPLGAALACLVILLDPHSSHVFYQILCQWNLRKQWFCCSVLYMRHLLPLWLILRFPFIHFKTFSIWQVFHHLNQGLRTEDDINSKDYKAVWSTTTTLFSKRTQ